MRALVFELDHSGHRMQYVRMLIEALTPLSKELVLFTSVDAAASEEYKTHLDGVTPSFRLETRQHRSRGTPLSSSLSKLEAFRVALRNCRPDHVYVPYADGLAQILGAAHTLGANSLPDGVEIEGIVMRGRFAYPSNHWYECLRTFAWLAATRMSPFQVLHQLDPIPYGAIKKIGGKLSDRNRIIPEPVEAIPQLGVTEARRQIGIPTDGRYIVSLGSGDVRKGTHLLLQAFARAKLATNDRLLLMGKLDREIRALVTAQMGPWIQDGRLIIIDQYLSHEWFCLGLNAADVICAPYPRHVGSSGIVVRAAAIGKPILASDYGWVGAVVPTFGLGGTCPVSNLDRFSNEIRNSLDNAASFRQTDEGYRFVRFHTISNFIAHITARFRVRIGAMPLTEHLPWEDVIVGAKNISPLLVNT
jgi:glycosyltransferase involved in cell wall biosynthesis